MSLEARSHFCQCAIMHKEYLLLQWVLDRRYPGSHGHTRKRVDGRNDTRVSFGFFS